MSTYLTLWVEGGGSTNDVYLSYLLIGGEVPRFDAMSTYLDHLYILHPSDNVIVMSNHAASLPG